MQLYQHCLYECLIDIKVSGNLNYYFIFYVEKVCSFSGRQSTIYLFYRSGSTRGSPTIPAQALTKNQVCAAQRRIACGFSSAHIWALCMLKIPFLVKNASSISVLGHAASATNEFHVLQTLEWEALTACTRLHVLVLGASFTRCSIFYSMARRSCYCPCY